MIGASGMKTKLIELFHLFRETVSEFGEDKATRLAAALSYFTVFSIAPLLIIIIAIAGAVLGEADVQRQLQTQISGMLGEEAAGEIETLIQNVRKPSESIPATAISLVTLLFGAIGVFAQLQDALNTVWGVTPAPNAGIMSMIRQRILSFGMVLVVGFLLLVSLVVNALLAGLEQFMIGLLPGMEVLLHILNLVISFGIITLLFAMIYKFLPDVDIEWRDVWIGAAFTALLFTIGKFAIGMYLGRSGVASAYGAAGSLVVILLWVFYSAQILLFGAEFTQVYARRYGSKIAPSQWAVPVTDDARAREGIPTKATVQSAFEHQQTAPKTPIKPVATVNPIPFTSQEQLEMEERDQELAQSAKKRDNILDILLALGATAVSFAIGVFVGTRADEK
jgi:membrane protein